MEHPLQRAWGLWAEPQTNPKTAARPRGRGARPPKPEPSPPKLFAPFDTVESMWRTMNFVRQPSQLELGTNLYIFINGVAPKWEDPANTAGGRWLMSFPQNGDAAWEMLFLLLIGETLDPHAEVTGIVAARRERYIRLSVWTGDKTHKAPIMDIGRKLKSALKPQTLEYQDHNADFKDFRYVIEC